MSILILVVGLFLLIASIIDLKTKALPSIFLTAMMFAVAVLNPVTLWFGILGFIMAYLLYESDFFGGIGDVKVMTIISFMIWNVEWLFAFIILVLILGVLWKVLLKVIKGGREEIPFIPVFLFVYIIVMGLGGRI